MVSYHHGHIDSREPHHWVAAMIDHFPDDTILAAASVPLRVSCLDEARSLTAGDRNRTYGDPVENMAHTASIVNAWTGLNLTARQIAQVYIAGKLARSQTSPLHRDSYVDVMAYRGIEFECAAAEVSDTSACGGEISI